MVKLWIGAVAAALCLPAMAEAACPAPLPERGAARLSFEAPLDEETRLGLGYALRIGLYDGESADWPLDLVGDDKGCEAGVLQADGERLAIRAGEGRAPLRWLTVDGSTIFLVLTPSDREAYALMQAGVTGEFRLRQPPFAALVRAPRGGGRLVLRLYDGLPSEAQVRADLAEAVAGRLPWIAAYDTASTAISFGVATRSNRNALLAQPPPGRGRAPARLRAGDGDYFIDQPDGSARMAASGYVCPARLAGLERLDLFLIESDPAASDQGCRFVADGEAVSLFISRDAARLGVERQLQTRLQEARFVEARGEAALIEGDGLVGRVWRDEDGRLQALYLRRRADWTMEFRATGMPGARVRLAQAARIAFAAFDPGAEAGD